ncbi:hypothetical protein Tco_0074198 [Tanacetum coccineum]
MSGVASSRQVASVLCEASIRTHALEVETQGNELTRSEGHCGSGQTLLFLGVDANRTRQDGNVQVENTNSTVVTCGRVCNALAKLSAQLERPIDKGFIRPSSSPGELPWSCLSEKGRTDVSDRVECPTRKIALRLGLSYNWRVRSKKDPFEDLGFETFMTITEFQVYDVWFDKTPSRPFNTKAWKTREHQETKDVGGILVENLKESGVTLERKRWTPGMELMFMAGVGYSMLW